MFHERNPLSATSPDAFPAPLRDLPWCNFNSPSPTLRGCARLDFLEQRRRCESHVAGITGISAAKVTAPEYLLRPGHRGNGTCYWAATVVTHSSRCKSSRCLCRARAALVNGRVYSSERYEMFWDESERT